MYCDTDKRPAKGIRLSDPIGVRVGRLHRDEDDDRDQERCEQQETAMARAVALSGRRTASSGLRSQMQLSRFQGVPNLGVGRSGRVGALLSLLLEPLRKGNFGGRLHFWGWGSAALELLTDSCYSGARRGY